MKILLFADTHLGFDFPIRPRIVRRRRGWDFFNNYYKILKTAIDEKVDVLLHAGDMFFRSKIPEMIIQKAYEPLLSVLDNSIDMFIIPGNHERSRLPQSPLFHHPGLHIFDRPRTYVIDRGVGRVAFGGFPNIRERVDIGFQPAIESSRITSALDCIRILCLHQSIEESVVGVQNYTFRKGHDVIGLDQFPRDLNLVISGHIHRQQVLRSSYGTPIIYPGSIERTSFAERLEKKGYYMIEILQDKINWEFRTLPTRPMIEIKLNSQLMDKHSILADLSARLPMLPDDSIIRIRPGNQNQLDLMKIAELRNYFPATCNVDISPPKQSHPRS
ncbi:DNA repair exonuclease [bacterium]|nr:DNA repair exonuclease [bacterium]